MHAIKKAMKKFEKIIIGVESINRIDVYNPFNFEERKEMIKKVFGKCEIFGIEDVGNDEMWKKLVLEKTKFDIVISGSEVVRICFKDVKKIINPDFLELEKYNGTKIRERIWKGEKWKYPVQGKVVSI